VSSSRVNGITDVFRDQDPAHLVAVFDPFGFENGKQLRSIGRERRHGLILRAGRQRDLTFTPPARATEAEMMTAIKNANSCFIVLSFSFVRRRR
jgi:hypothetical protein